MITKAPEWFQSRMMPGMTPLEVVDEWLAYLSTVTEVQYHGIRTGDGPNETFVGVEWPDNDHLPPFMRRPDRRAVWEELEFPQTVTSFEWGYVGSGPLVLSATLIIHCVDTAMNMGKWRASDATPQYVNNNFRSDLCEKIVSRLPRHEWTLPHTTLLEFLELHLKAKMNP